MATRKPTFDELLQQSREQSFYNSLPKDKSFDELLAEYGNQTLDNDYYNKAISGLSNAHTTDAWNVSAMGRRFSLGAYVNPLDYWKQRGQAGVNAKTLQSRERELSLRGFDTAGLAEAGASYDEMLKAYVGMDVGRSSRGHVNLDLRWNPLRTNLEFGGVKASHLRLDTLAMGLGVGLRF